MTEEKRAIEVVCDKWLDGWAAVVRERRETGDAAAIPKMAMEFSPGGGRSASPSNMPSVIDAYLDVEACIDARAVHLRELLEFLHIDGVELRIAKGHFRMPDDSVIELSGGEIESGQLPKGFIDCEIEHERIVTKRLKEFVPSALAVETIAFGVSRVKFFAWSYRCFRHKLIHEKGLAKLAARQITGKIIYAT